MGSILTTSDPVLLQLGLSTPTAAQSSIVEQAIKWAESAVRRHIQYDPVQRTRTEYYPQTQISNVIGYSVLEASETQAYVRELTSAATSELQLRHLPIRSITGLYIDYDGRFGQKSGAFASESLKAQGTDYWLQADGTDDSGDLICRSGIIHSVGRWPSEPGSVKVVYVAGYTADEFAGNGLLVDASPIYEAIVFEATRKAKQSIMLASGAGTSGSSGVGFTAGSVQSERMGDYSYTLGSSSGGSSSSAAGGLYDGVRDLSAESLERLNDFVNVGFALFG